MQYVSCTIYVTILKFTRFIILLFGRKIKIKGDVKRRLSSGNASIYCGQKPLLLVSCKQSKTKNENILITYTVSYECENACYFMERTHWRNFRTRR